MQQCCVLGREDVQTEWVSCNLEQMRADEPVRTWPVADDYWRTH